MVVERLMEALNSSTNSLSLLLPGQPVLDWNTDGWEQQYDDDFLVAEDMNSDDIDNDLMSFEDGPSGGNIDLTVSRVKSDLGNADSSGTHSSDLTLPRLEQYVDDHIAANPRLSQKFNIMDAPIDMSETNVRQTRSMGPVRDEPYVQPKILERALNRKQ